MSRAMKAVPLVVLCALIVAVPSVWANWVLDGVAICTATGDQHFPTIVSDGAGGAFVTWHDLRSGSANLDIFVQSVNASGAVQWAVDGMPLCTATGSQEYPKIISDDAGGAIVTWADYRNGSDWNIFAQRVNAKAAVLWTIDGVALCAATGWQNLPTITSDGAGGAIVTWQDERSGNRDIYAQGVNASGGIQWTGNGVALCTRTGDQDSPTIISDGAGGAIVTWYDYRSGAPDIYAQRVNSKGAVLWTTDGVPLCTAANYQTLPTIVSDDAGGAIVTWGDRRSGNYHIYAQRVNASGVVQWTANGVALCTAMGDQWVPTIVPDGAGGAIVTWYDVRSGNSDIYAQRVSALGVVQWAANGVPLCTATGDQSYPQIISDGAGGAIITWMDDRSGNSDIYALRIDANGSTGVTASDAPAVPIELQQNYPNPFNPTTTVAYSVPERCNVALKIYDVSGKCVARLVDKEQEKGSYTVAWNGKDETGNSMASGIYLYRLSAGNQTIAKKMVLLR